MKKSSPPQHKTPAQGVAKRVIDNLVKEPNEWFDITDEINSISHARTMLSSHVARHYTPLRLRMYQGRIYAVWATKEE